MQTPALELTDNVGQLSLGAWQQRFRDHMLSIDHLFDPSHRIDHIDRVMQNALNINDTEQGNLAVIVPAAMLHDCVFTDKKSPLRAQASQRSAAAALELLQHWGYPATHHTAIASAIASHSYSANIATTSLEAHIVQDADRLDSLGAVGIARTFMLAGTFNNVLYAHADPFAKHRPLNDKQYALDHFYQKLLSLEETFKTAAGKRIAAQRTQRMQAYLKHIAEEIHA
jgi:uncharacterized protein